MTKAGIFRAIELAFWTGMAVTLVPVAFGHYWSAWLSFALLVAAVCMNAYNDKRKP